MVASSFAMMLFILFLQLFRALKADYTDYTVKCVDDSHRGTVFEPSTDGVKFRYNVEWCTELNKKANTNETEWNLLLSFNLLKNEHNCHKNVRRTYKHSEFTVVLDAQYANCTHICFYTSLDLVFSSCFILENWLSSMGSYIDLHSRYVNNNLTLDSLKKNIIYADAVNHEKHVAVHWYLNQVVATSFEMQLCENHTAAAGERKNDRCEQINDKCTVTLPSRNEIVCELWNLTGSYYIDLTNTAPWKVGVVGLFQKYAHYNFNVTDGRVWVSPPPPPAASPALAWACGALLAACAAAAAAGCAWRRRKDARLQRRVRDSWLCRPTKPGIEPAPTRCVLLLYAREGDGGAPLIRALTDLLEGARVKVLDLYSPEVVSLSAPCSSEWLRGALRGADVRVLLLQTPSLAALHGGGGVPLEAGAEAALLHRKVTVVPMEPSPNDGLLSLALRALAEDVHTPAPYNKYFLATLETLETDTLPYTVPFRRYRLPADAGALLQDLQPGARPGAGAARALRAAAHGFIQHVRDRPAYLKDHLLLIE